jgi:CotH protein
MTSPSVQSRSALQPLCLLLALGAQHCGSDATIIDTTSGAIRPAPDAAGPDAPGTAPVSDDARPIEGASANGGEVVRPASIPEGGPAAAETPRPGDEVFGMPVAPVPSGTCQPRAAGGPFWLEEGDTIELTIECATGASLPPGGLEVPNLPAHASIDPARAIITFSPGLDQAGVYALELKIAGGSDRGVVEVQVADRFDAPGNVPVNPATYTEEFGLPVVHLTVDAAINDEDYLPATITYRGHTFQGAEAKYRGQTSLSYPKNSYTLKFTKEDRFGEPLRATGLEGKRRVTLTTTFDDNSYLRTRLAFELWNRIGEPHVDVQAYNAVVYLNGEFWGLYTVTDHVDRHLMEDYGFDEGGNLYKARTNDANFRLTRAAPPYVPKDTLSEGYTKEEGAPVAGEPGASSDLEALVNWVATSTPEEFRAELDTHIAREEYENWWLLISLILAGDSAGKNSYHYHDPRADAPDARFHVVPWDFNDSFGQTFYDDHTGREATRNLEKLSEYNLLFQRLLGDPATRAPLTARYRVALDDEWELGSVLEALDTWASENEPVALRDERKWSTDYAAYFAARRTSELTTHTEEIAYVRSWIIERWAYVRDYYPAVESSTGAAGAGL